MEELQLHSAKIGLPDREALKFFCFYESKGWKVGKSPMKSWRSAMGGWKLRWEENRDKPNANIQAIVSQKELEAIKQKMNSIRRSYMEHQAWSERDLSIFRELKARAIELKARLGIQV